VLYETLASAFKSNEQELNYRQMGWQAQNQPGSTKTYLTGIT